jgi:small-conductance mechanosensitive channel
VGATGGLLLQADILQAVTEWNRWITPLAGFTATLLAGLLLKRWLFRFVHKWSAVTGTSVDDIAVEAVRQPFTLWVLMLAIHVAAQSSQLPQRYAGFLARVLLILWIVSLTVVAARIASSAVRRYGSRLHSGLQVTTLTENITRVVVIVLGGLILLNEIGVSITPILTALGVGGLAVALALQDTLSNFFAGFYLMIAGQIRVGDYVKLDTGEEGYVVDISWRSLTIRTLPNNIVVVPNSKVAQANVTNYSLPEQRMSLLIKIGVSYDSDPDRIEQILVEEAIAASADIPGLLAEPAPFVRFIPGFGDFSLDFTLIVQVSEFVDQYLVQHELRKRVFRRFRKEAIEIPFPIRTLHVRSMTAETNVDTTKGSRNAVDGLAAPGIGQSR